MKYFTHDEMTPSRKTLDLIRQIAYTCKVITVNGREEVMCLN